MPVLPTTIEPLSETQQKELAAIAEHGNQVAETFYKSILPVYDLMNLYFEPIRRAQEMVASFYKPMQIMQDAIATLSIVTFKDLGLGMLPKTDSLLSHINFINPLSTQAIDIEPEETDNNQPGYPKKALMPRPSFVPAIQGTFTARAKGKMGLSITAANTFLFKRHHVKGLSAKNAEGRLLALLYKSKDMFINDDTVRNELYLKTNRNFSWVLRNLKNKLKKNGIKILLERCWNPDGYILNGIEYLQ